eukprot:gb/GECG01010800.1/.p1 GENE.gb/GECG01010800.1/~~gb/GECG01010800.1/.p1  ORF type:complete len:197 (+),score=16.25 gb/GECG01010800.1/:1-591(+)
MTQLVNVTLWRTLRRLAGASDAHVRKAETARPYRTLCSLHGRHRGSIKSHRPELVSHTSPLIQIRTVKTRSQKRAKDKAMTESKWTIDRDQLYKLYQTLDSGLQQMVRSNKKFDINHDGEEFTIDTEMGQIRLFLSESQGAEVLALTTPKQDNPAGMHLYRFDPTLDEWVGYDDGHFLKEMLSRELVFYCKGYPTF